MNSLVRERSNSLSSVFRLCRPRIDTNSASVEEVIQTIRKRPSGAPSYSIDGIEYKDQNDRGPIIIVLKNGPYLITGG